MSLKNHVSPQWWAERLTEAHMQWVPWAVIAAILIGGGAVFVWFFWGMTFRG